MVNSEGDWKKQADAIAEWKKCRGALRDWMDGLCDVYDKTEKAAAKVFTSTPEFDCHFVDSPIAPAKLLHEVKAYLNKKGSPLAKGYAAELEDFNKDVDSAVKWATKLNNSKK